MLTFRPGYFFLTLLLFAVEVYIALYVKDDWIRPYGGDYLVVILLYCLVRSFLRIAVWPAAVGVLLFSYAIEGLQAIGLVELLGLQDNQLATVVIGTDFAWKDMWAYTLGIGTVILAESAKQRRPTQSSGSTDG